jgi:DnaJ-class molecular chaperone
MNSEIDKDKECLEIIKMKDYYEILRVKKDAGEEEIRKSYKKLAIKFHPDKNNSTHSSDAFKKVSHAFSVLSDKEKRQRYDMFGTEEEIQSGGSHFQGEMDPFV